MADLSGLGSKIGSQRLRIEKLEQDLDQLGDGLPLWKIVLGALAAIGTIVAGVFFNLLFKLHFM